MKPLTPLTLVLLCTLAGTAGAQTQATAPVAAKVLVDLQLASTGTTDFGSIGNFAHTETIDPRAPTASQSTAQFNSASSSSVIYTCPTSVTLAGPETAVMTFTTDLTVHPSADGQSASGPVNCRDGTILNVSPVFFWLGGSLGVASNQAAGSYSGVFTLTAQYP